MFDRDRRGHDVVREGLVLQAPDARGERAGLRRRARCRVMLHRNAGFAKDARERIDVGGIGRLEDALGAAGLHGLVDAPRVIGQEFDVARMAQEAEDVGDGAGVALEEVDARDEDASQREVRAGGVERAERAEDGVEVAAGVLAQAGGVGVLEVEENRVRERGETRSERGIEGAARLDAGPDPRLARGGEERERALRLRHRLAAGERKASLPPVERRVAAHEPEQLRDASLFADTLQRTGGARRGARAAGNALRAVEDALRRAPMRAVRAGRGTCAAADAPRGDEANLGLGALRLGVVAPCAAQRAALEEDDGPDPRSVAHREALYVGHAQNGRRGVEWWRHGLHVPVTGQQRDSHPS